MNKIEQSIKTKLVDKRIFLFIAIITFGALLIRFELRSFVSIDYTVCLSPWFKEIKRTGGILALKHQVGDYNILYQFLISLSTYLPFKNLYMYKMLSVVFDFVLAISCAFLASSVCSSSNKKLFFALTYASILFAPTTFLNSAAWAQCDSIYTSFLVISFICLLSNRNIASFVLLGVAFAFKFQTIFASPLYLLVYIKRNDIHWWHFLITVGVFWLSGLPGYFFGRSIFSVFSIYLNQTNIHHSLYMGYPNFAGVFNQTANMQYPIFSKVFIMLTIAIIASAYLSILSHNELMYDRKTLISLLTWTIYTCVMFLPNMHDRYAFAVDMLLIVICMFDHRIILIVIAEIFMSFISYGNFLHITAPLNMVCLSILSLLIYVLFTVHLASKITIQANDK